VYLNERVNPDIHPVFGGVHEVKARIISKKRHMKIS
jgi:hypothetical protein